MFTSLRHALIRRKAKVEELPTSRFSVRLARTTDDYAMAFNLVQVSYAYLGIEHLGKRLYRMTDQHILPESYVLLAWEGDRVVGTISVTLDSPAGLPLDNDYPEVLTPLRRNGAQMAEIGSYAVVQKRRHSGVAQLLGVAAARLIWQLGCSHTVIGIHPKAVPIYAALWGFSACGAPKGHGQLHADVAAMSVTREGQRSHLRRKMGRHEESGRSVEDLCFGAAPIPNTESDCRRIGDRIRQPRMPRETFQSLFMEDSNHLQEVSAQTLRYVRSLRSDETLGIRQGAERALAPPQISVEAAG